MVAQQHVLHHQMLKYNISEGVQPVMWLPNVPSRIEKILIIHDFDTINKDLLQCHQFFPFKEIEIQRHMKIPPSPRIPQGCQMCHSNTRRHLRWQGTLLVASHDNDMCPLRDIILLLLT